MCKQTINHSCAKITIVAFDAVYAFGFSPITFVTLVPAW